MVDHSNYPSREEVNQQGVCTFEPHHHCLNYYFAWSLGGAFEEWQETTDSLSHYKERTPMRAAILSSFQHMNYPPDKGKIVDHRLFE